MDKSLIERLRTFHTMWSAVSSFGFPPFRDFGAAHEELLREASTAFADAEKLLRDEGGWLSYTDSELFRVFREWQQEKDKWLAKYGKH